MHDERPSDFVTHLECSATGEALPHDRLHGLSPAGAPLLVRYDLGAVRASVTKPDLSRRSNDMWRLRELLPVPRDARPVQLGEAATPLVRLERLASEVGMGTVLIKDESRLPTGSFKARGMAMAVTMARRFGVRHIAVPTAGNAGSAAAAYGARAGMDVSVFMPSDTFPATVDQIRFYGARGAFVDGLIDRCGERVRAGTAAHGWHDLSTMAEPYRLEGKKTMGLELAEQLHWRLPDIIYYPTGGGTGFIGMWKAFRELRALGWVDDPLPRMVAVQATGCHPIVDAYERGLDHVPEPWPDPATRVHGTRVPKPLADRLILTAIRDSSGHATEVADADAMAMQHRLAETEGIATCLEGALCVAALAEDRRNGRVRRSDRVVVFNTGSHLSALSGAP